MTRTAGFFGPRNTPNTRNLGLTTFNIQQRRSNVQHPTFNVQRSRMIHAESLAHGTRGIHGSWSHNVEHSTSNIQRSTSNSGLQTSNIQRPTSNIQRSRMIHAEGLAHGTRGIHGSSVLQRSTSNIERSRMKHAEGFPTDS